MPVTLGVMNTAHINKMKKSQNQTSARIEFIETQCLMFWSMASPPWKQTWSTNPTIILVSKFFRD